MVFNVPLYRYWQTQIWFYMLCHNWVKPEDVAREAFDRPISPNNPAFRKVFNHMIQIGSIHYEFDTFRGEVRSGYEFGRLPDVFHNNPKMGRIYI